MKRGFDRTQRVADLIQKALAQILLQEMNDERFRFVTITSVEVSRDLSYAKVYVSMLQDDSAEIKQVIKDLNQEVKSIRYNLARAVKLRITPELKFVYDESTAHGFKISNLIDAAVKKSGK
jgi:ribosome-binding factor A